MARFFTLLGLFVPHVVIAQGITNPLGMNSNQREALAIWVLVYLGLVGAWIIWNLRHFFGVKKVDSRILKWLVKFNVITLSISVCATILAIAAESYVIFFVPIGFLLAGIGMALDFVISIGLLVRR